MTSKVLEGLLAQIDRPLLDQLREEWSWRVPADLRVMGMTMMGDWLFTNAGGSVLMLETVEATLDQVAKDLRDLEARVAAPEVRDETFLEGLALGCLGGRALPRNYCVGFRVPPVLGGRFDLSNLEPVPVGRYQAWTGRLHQAVAQVPAGRQITGVDVDDTGAVSVRWQ